MKVKSERTSIIKMGNYICKKRKLKGYTQKQLSEIIDISDKTISKWEQGDLAPDVTMLKLLAETLDTNIESIVCGYDISSSFGFSLFKSRKSLIIFFMVFTLFVSIICFSLGGRGKCEYYRLSASSPFKVYGYLINNDNESIIIIEKITVKNLSDNLEKDIIKSAIVTFYFDEKVIGVKNYDIREGLTLEDFFNEYSFSLSEDVKINKDNLKIKYEFFNLQGDKFEFLINF